MTVSFRNFIRSIASISIMSCGIVSTAAMGQASDTLRTERRNQQNVLLNAASDSQPCVIVQELLDIRHIHQTIYNRFSTHIKF